MAVFSIDSLWLFAYILVAFIVWVVMFVLVFLVVTYVHEYIHVVIAWVLGVRIVRLELGVNALFGRPVMEVDGSGWRVRVVALAPTIIGIVGIVVTYGVVDSIVQPFVIVFFGLIGVPSQPDIMAALSPKQ